MALFSNLFDAARVVATLLQDRILDPPLKAGTVIVAAPREAADDTIEQLRVSLLWTSEHPTHVSDGWQRGADGGERPPPLTLSAFFLVTAYGNNASTQEPVRGLQLLGDALRVLHDVPRLRLPGATTAACGEGDLGLRVVPMAPELLEKLFGPLQLKHRPFALLEASPVQLPSIVAPRAPGPVVRPGGVRLSPPDLATAARPVIDRIVPSTQGVGGRIRVEGRFPAAPARVWVGAVRVEGGAFSTAAADRQVSLVLPTTPPDVVAPGIHNVAVLAAGTPSEPLPIAVVDAGTPTVDAPLALTHSRAAPLVLTGRSLAGAAEVVAWPDAGVQSPSEVVSLAPGAVAPGEVTIAPAQLARLRDRSYRLAVRTGPYQYTPFVVLEVTP